MENSYPKAGSTYPTLPSNKNESFLVLVQGKCDYYTEAFGMKEHEEYGQMLHIAAEEGYIYITREQARVFFGFA